MKSTSIKLTVGGKKPQTDSKQAKKHYVLNPKSQYPGNMRYTWIYQKVYLYPVVKSDGLEHMLWISVPVIWKSLKYDGGGIKSTVRACLELQAMAGELERRVSACGIEKQMRKQIPGYIIVF